VGLIHIMNCREIAALLDTDQVQDQNWVNRIQVRVHIWICWHCRRLARQIRWLKKLARESASVVSENPGLETRILQKLTSPKQ
jgi:hypothetical protein